MQKLKQRKAARMREAKKVQDEKAKVKREQKKERAQAVKDMKKFAIGMDEVAGAVKNEKMRFAAEYQSQSAKYRKKIEEAKTVLERLTRAFEEHKAGWAKLIKITNQNGFKLHRHRAEQLHSLNVKRAQEAMKIALMKRKRIELEQEYYHAKEGIDHLSNELLSEKANMSVERSKLENGNVELARAKHKEAQLLKQAASVKEKAFKEHMHAKALIAKLSHQYRKEENAKKVLKMKMAQALLAEKVKMAVRLKEAAMKEWILRNRIANSMTSPGARELQEELHWLTMEHLMAKKKQLAHVLSVLEIAIKKETVRSKRKIAILMNDLAKVRKERADQIAQHTRSEAELKALRTKEGNALRRQKNKIRQLFHTLVKEKGRAKLLQNLLVTRQHNHNERLKVLERIRLAVRSITILVEKKDRKAAKVIIAQALRAFRIAEARLLKQIHENNEKIRLENLKLRHRKIRDNAIWNRKLESEKRMKIKDNLSIKRETAKTTSARLRHVKLIQHLKSVRAKLSKELKILKNATVILKTSRGKLNKGLAHQRSLTERVKNEKAKVKELAKDAKVGAAQQRSKAARLKEALANKVLGERVATVRAHLVKLRSTAKVQQAKVTAELSKEKAKVKKMKGAYLSLRRAYHLLRREFKRRVKHGKRYNAESTKELKNFKLKLGKLLQKNRALALLIKKQKEDIANEVEGERKQTDQDAVEFQSVRKSDAMKLRLVKTRAKRTLENLTYVENELRQAHQALLGGKADRAHWLREIEKLREQLRLEETIEERELEKIRARTIHFGHVLRRERAKIAKRIRLEKESETQEIEDVKAKETKATNRATKHAAQVMKELKQKNAWTIRELQSISVANRERLRRLKLRAANELEHIAAKNKWLKESIRQEGVKIALQLEHLRGIAAHSLHRVKAKDVNALTTNRQLIHLLAHDQKEMARTLKNLRAEESKNLRKMKNRARLEIARSAAQATSLGHQFVQEKVTAARELKKEKASESAEIKREGEKEALALKERASKDKHLAQNLSDEKTRASLMLRQQKLFEANRRRKERARVTKLLRQHIANERQYSHEIHMLIMEGIQRDISLKREEAKLDKRLQAIIIKQTKLLEPLQDRIRKLIGIQTVAMKELEQFRVQEFHLRTLLEKEETVLPRMAWKLLHESIKFRMKGKELKYLRSRVADLHDELDRNSRKLKLALLHESSLSHKLANEKLELIQKIKPMQAAMAIYEKKLEGVQHEDGELDQKKVTTVNKLRQIKVVVKRLKAKLVNGKKRLSITAKQERHLLKEISKVEAKASQILAKVESAKSKAIQMATRIKRLKAAEVKLKLSSAQARDKARKDDNKIKRLSVQVDKESVRVAAVTRKLNFISTIQQVKKIKSENVKLVEELRRWKLKRAKEHNIDVLIGRKEKRESAWERSAKSNLEKLLKAVKSSQNDVRNSQRVHKNLEKEKEHRKMLLHRIARLRRKVAHWKDAIEKVHEVNKRRNQRVDLKLKAVKTIRLALAAARR